MERYVFDIATYYGIKHIVVESGGECYSVKMDDTFMGTMWQDVHHAMQWVTEDQALEAYLWDISTALSEAFTKKGFPVILQGAYPEIRHTQWTGSDTLEVILKPETDLEVFCTFLKDEVANLVDFEQHLDLMLRIENDDYFKIIGVN